MFVYLCVCMNMCVMFVYVYFCKCSCICMEVNGKYRLGINFYFLFCLREIFFVIYCCVY